MKISMFVVFVVSWPTHVGSMTDWRILQFADQERN
jgi:hypothetical protein